jgi:hypothetical protein
MPLVENMFILYYTGTQYTYVHFWLDKIVTVHIVYLLLITCLKKYCIPLVRFDNMFIL